MSQHERTGWRDEEISNRHRMWGVNVPALDVDFLMLEYDTGKPRALVEYKHERAAPVDLSHASYCAVRSLAIASKIPFFVCRYCPGDDWRFTVAPVCNLAKTIVAADTEFSEEGYVEFLYRLRGRVMPNAVRQWIGEHA